MTFRSGSLSRSQPALSLSDLQEGQKIKGRVKKIEVYGLFIEIEGSKVSGLCHKSEVCVCGPSVLGNVLKEEPAVR